MYNTQSYVEWDYPGTDTTGFYLERSVDSGSTWPVRIALTGSVYSYTDNDVVWEGTYWYRVAPYNPIGIGHFSTMASVFIYPNWPFGIPTFTASLMGIPPVGAPEFTASLSFI